MAPPNSKSFSVKVVLPASGWEMMANVLLRLISLDISVSVTDKILERVHVYVHRLQRTALPLGLCISPRRAKPRSTA